MRPILTAIITRSLDPGKSINNRPSYARGGSRSRITQELCTKGTGSFSGLGQETFDLEAWRPNMEEYYDGSRREMCTQEYDTKSKDIIRPQRVITMEVF